MQRAPGLYLSCAIDSRLLRRLDGARAFGVGASNCVVTLSSLLDVQTLVFHDHSYGYPNLSNPAATGPLRSPLSAY